MSFRLQRYDFRSSGYERPNRDWLCGRLKDGQPCAQGPTGMGLCRGGFACHPLRDGDRWLCARGAAAGGRCNDGPGPDGRCAHAVLPCRPHRTSRRLRRDVTGWAVALVVIALIASLDIVPGLQATVSPGPLSQAHALIGDCRACHGFAPSGTADLLTRAVHGQPNDSAAGSCAKCHAGQAGGTAHNLPQPVLAAITKGKKPDAAAAPWPSRLALALGVPAREAGRAGHTCLSCHTEHHGRDSAPTAVSSLTCNRCHAVRFAGIADGHPPFTAFPVERRQRIRFDHAAHLAKHLKGASAAPGAPKTCRDCHVMGAAGAAMLTRGFEATCAACHAGDLQRQAVVLLAIPKLDLAALRAHKARIGEWPADAARKGMPELMGLLLAGNEAFRRAWQGLARERVDLADLGGATKSQLDQVETVAWEIKRLVFRLVEDGPPGLLRDLADRYGSGIERRPVAELFRRMPVDAIRLLQSKAFPRLEDELDALEGPKKQRAETTATRLPAQPGASGGSWALVRGGLQHAFNDHDTTTVMRGLIELAVEADQHAPDGATKALLAEVSGRAAPGRCLGCHSVDATARLGARVNWQGFRADRGARPLTVFRHAPHVITVDSDCTVCHRVDEKADFAASYKGGDPHAFASAFNPLTTADCARCHTPALAGDSCLTCHRYHSGLAGEAAAAESK